MAHWKKSFPSRFLQAAELDRPFVATVAGLADENVGAADAPDVKPVLRFQEAGAKAVVMNLTRSEAMEAIVGDPDTDHWLGHRVKVYRGTTRYGGKRVPCICLGPADDTPITEEPF